MIKKLISLFLSVSVFLSTTAQAAALRNGEEMIKLFDEYLFHVKSQQPGPIFLEYGRQKYLSRGVIAQASTLEPEDFNRFMFNLMERYVNKPEDRRYIFNFFSATTETLLPDFEYSRRLQEGPESFALEGTYKIGAWFMVAGSVALMVATRKGWNINMGQWVAEREAALTQMNKYYGLGFKYATSPTSALVVGSTAAGALGGYLEQKWYSTYTYRHNPMSALMVVQAQLVCHLSYEGLSVAQQFEAVKDNEEELAKNAPELRKKISAIKSEAAELKGQWNRLVDLKDLMADKFFRELMSQYPKEQNWQGLVKSLQAAEESRDGKCRGLSTFHLMRELDKIVEELPAPVESIPQPVPVPEAK